MKYTIDVYQTKEKKRPFYIWLDEQDRTVRHIIIARLDRIRAGNLGNCSFLRDEISEIKFNQGPGYRIYYNSTGIAIILLLCAGIKKTQTKDIDKAIAYLDDYKRRNHGKKSKFSSLFN